MPAKISERQIQYQQKRKAGNCPRCGVKKKKSYTFIYCEDCRAYFRGYNKAKSEEINNNRKIIYNLRKESRQCPRCGIKLGRTYKKIICPQCLEKQYQYIH